MEKTTKTIIGLDIGSHSIKAVKVEKIGSEVRILDFAIKPIIEKTAEGLISPESIKNILNDLGKENSQIFLALSSQDIAVKYAVVPFMPKEELRDAVRWSLKEVVNFNLDESILDFQILGTITGTDGIKRNEVLAVAVTRVLIERNVKLLQAAGVDPAFITTSHFAIGNLINANERIMVGKTNALIDIGVNETNILIFKGSALQFMRKITSAGESFTRALSGVVVTFPQKVELDAKQAEELKIKCGIPSKSEQGSSYKDIPLSQISVLMRPVLERLLTDIRGSFKYFREEFHVESIDQIFLSGGGASLKNLPEFLKDGLGGIPTQLISLPQNITAQLPAGKDLTYNLPNLGVSIGVCLPKEGSINLLPTSVKIQKTIGVQQRALQFVIPLLLIFMSFNLYWMWQKGKYYQKILTAYNDYYSSLVKLRSLRDNVITRKKFFDEVIGSELNIFVYLKELSRVIPKSIEFKQLVFNKQDGSFFIQGLVYASDRSAENSLAAFLLDMENSAYFNNVTLISSKKETDNKLEVIGFELTVSLSKVRPVK
jgi:type IV pilus assembly protein PilM